MNTSAITKSLLASAAFMAWTVPALAQEVPDETEVVIDLPAPVDDGIVDDGTFDGGVIDDGGLVDDGGIVDDGTVIDEIGDGEVIVDDGGFVVEDPGVVDGGEIVTIDDPVYVPGDELVDPPVELADNEVIYYMTGGPAGEFENDAADQAAELAAEQVADRVSERVELAAASAATTPDSQ